MQHLSGSSLFAKVPSLGFPISPKDLSNLCQLAAKFGVFINEDHNKCFNDSLKICDHMNVILADVWIGFTFFHKTLTSLFILVLRFVLRFVL